MKESSIANSAERLYMGAEPGEEVEGYVSQEEEVSDDEQDDLEY